MARKLLTRVTCLEMRQPSAWHCPAPLTPRLALMRAPGMPLAFYRYLYEQVGREHHWSLRRNLADDALAAAIHADCCRIHILYADGSPAGFFELDLAGLPESAAIVYLGLTPDFQGIGLGRFLLSEALAAGWEEQPQRLTIETNTLDNPRALRLYQLAGFVPCGWREEEIEAWE
jgi:GNAT superfamily N-acetyltransferase